MIKISHEVPLCLLEDSLEFNDYQYCLPHLIDKYPKYKQFFLDYGRNGGFIIMDNGLFEGINHTMEDLIEKINLIKPDIFIVPDEWNDAPITRYNSFYWMDYVKKELPPNTELMAVLQFTNYEEAIWLYRGFVDIGYKHIAFNHSSKGYDDLFPHSNKIFSQMMGRINLINKLNECGVIKKNLYHHLLGCSSILEFQHYNYPEYDFIKSLDTSSPIVFSYEKMLYSNEGSMLYKKPTTKIIDIMEEPYSSFNGLLNVNIDLFKRWVSGE